MELNKLYFYTATIIKWKHLLEQDNYKDILINNLKYLVNKKKITIFGFVIMPNHIHLIFEILELNGKEYPDLSFMKYTSHSMLKELQINNLNLLKEFKVELKTRTHQFWQRNHLSIHLYSSNIIFQKLNYIHNNPLQEKWMLANSPINYKYSSAYFYETKKDIFGILTHIQERI